MQLCELIHIFSIMVKYYVHVFITSMNFSHGVLYNKGQKDEIHSCREVWYKEIGKHSSLLPSSSS